MDTSPTTITLLLFDGVVLLFNCCCCCWACCCCGCWLCWFWAGAAWLLLFELFEHGLPSLTNTGTATRRGELADCVKIEEINYDLEFTRFNAHKQFAFNWILFWISNFGHFFSFFFSILCFVRFFFFIIILRFKGINFWIVATTIITEKKLRINFNMKKNKIRFQWAQSSFRTWLCWFCSAIAFSLAWRLHLYRWFWNQIFTLNWKKRTIF